MKIHIDSDEKLLVAINYSAITIIFCFSCVLEKKTVLLIFFVKGLKIAQFQHNVLVFCLYIL